MKLNHIAFWTHDIDTLIDFYCAHFSGKVVTHYNKVDFSSAFLLLEGHMRLELLSKPNLDKRLPGDSVGHSHISFEVSSKVRVDQLTNYFKQHNIRIEKECIQYDEGFYESAIFDPDDNIIEFAYIEPKHRIEPRTY